MGNKRGSENPLLITTLSISEMFGSWCMIRVLLQLNAGFGVAITCP